MQNWGRWVAIAAIVGVVVWALWGPSGGGRTRGGGEWRPEWADPQFCAGCHPDIVREWSGGMHALASTDPEMDHMSLNPGISPIDCDSCHASRPVFETLGRTPAPRLDSPEWPSSRGVDCLSCHGTPQGMATGNPRFRDGPAPDPAAAPCRPVYRAEIREVTHCESCHNQHKTVDQWRKTRYGDPAHADFATCQTCHMPKQPGPGTTGGAGTHHWGHHMTGAHTPAAIRTAAKLSAARRGESVVVTVDTRATGHNFPTDYRTRFGLLVAEAVDDRGAVARELGRLKWRQPFRHEPGGSDPAGNTQIAGDTVHEFPFPIGEHAGPVRVRLFYSLRPYNDSEHPGEFTLKEIVGNRMFLVHEVTVR